ncbi:Cell wall / vacuolar inhibitor of fructosidase 2 [Linum grandiflorum]
MDNSTISAVFSIVLFLTFSSLAQADTSLIQKTCKSTKYYDLCLSSLNSNSTSSTADVKGLALIMIGIGMANATATSTYLSSQLAAAATSNNNDAALKKAVLKECADKYMYAGDALQSSVEDMGIEDYDYASIHVTAAADYPNACRNAFLRNPGRLVYPPELARREDGLKRICDVVLHIIDLLIGN